MTAPNPAEWLTIADAAREIGLHPQTVAKHIKAGAMPGILFGNTYRIPRVQFEQWKAGTWKAAPPVALVHRRAKSLSNVA